MKGFSPLNLRVFILVTAAACCAYLWYFINYSWEFGSLKTHNMFSATFFNITVSSQQFSLSQHADSSHLSLFILSIIFPDKCLWLRTFLNISAHLVTLHLPNLPVCTSNQTVSVVMEAWQRSSLKLRQIPFMCTFIQHLDAIVDLFINSSVQYVSHLFYVKFITSPSSSRSSSILPTSNLSFYLYSLHKHCVLWQSK